MSEPIESPTRKALELGCASALRAPVKAHAFAAAIELLEDDERFVTWYRLNYERLDGTDDDPTYAAIVRHYLDDVASGCERLAPEERPCGDCGRIEPCRCDDEADWVATGGGY